MYHHVVLSFSLSLVSLRRILQSFVLSVQSLSCYDLLVVIRIIMQQVIHDLTKQCCNRPSSPHSPASEK
jgi:hypothetical protein